MTAQLAKRKLNRRDQALANQFAQIGGDPIDHELSFANLNELAREIDRQRDPRLKQILVDEFNRLKALADLGPIPQPEEPPPSGMMNPVLRGPLPLTPRLTDYPPTGKHMIDPTIRPNPQPGRGTYPLPGGVRG